MQWLLYDRDLHLERVKTYQRYQLTLYPMNERNLNVRLLNVLCTFNLRLVSSGSADLIINFKHTAIIDFKLILPTRCLSLR